MSTNDPVKALEIVNKEYIELLNSPEYRLGRRINKIKSSITHLRFNELLGYYKSIKSQKKMAAVSGHTNPIEEVIYNPGIKYKGQDRGVVYTCITSGYDKLQYPVLITTDFVLFTDDLNISPKSVWQAKNISTASGYKGNKINRYYKMHPSDNLHGYRYSIYVDGNVQVVGDVSRLFLVAESSKYGIAMHKHPVRWCTYIEAKACIAAERGNPEAIKKQMDRYRLEGFPENYGFCEATIIVVDNNNPMSRTILDSWWEEFLNADSGRDQLALPYVLWKHGVPTEEVSLLGNNLLFNPFFRIVNLGEHKFR